MGGEEGVDNKREFIIGRCRNKQIYYDEQQTTTTYYGLFNNINAQYTPKYTINFCTIFKYF